MILGIGTDIIEVERIERNIANESFKNKVFSPQEIEYCESKANKSEHYAARFAAKEAFVKALGTGFVKGLFFNEVTVENNEQGKPSIVLLGTTAELIITKGVKSVYVSLAHVKSMATATVVIEC